MRVHLYQRDSKHIKLNKHWSDGRKNKPTVTVIWLAQLELKYFEGGLGRRGVCVCVRQGDEKQEEVVKFFLDSWWSALRTVCPEISFPKAGFTCCHVVQRQQSGRGVHRLHNQGHNYYKKYKMYFMQRSPTVCWGGKNINLGAYRHNSFLCSSLPRYTRRSHSLYRHLLIHCRLEVMKTRSVQGPTHLSSGFRQNGRKKKIIKIPGTALKWVILPIWRKVVTVQEYCR